MTEKLQEALDKLQENFKEISTLLREADFDKYRSTPSNKCYDNRNVDKVLSSLYNGIADTQNYVNVYIK